MLLPLCHIDLFDSSACRTFNVLNCTFFVIKNESSYHAYINQCPHLNIPLELVADHFLDIDQEYIQCSTHGALFTIQNGHCISGPCAGQSLIKIDISIKNNTLYLCQNSLIKVSGQCDT
jgi:nitrite reductase/ring-hydroxylating ferredoxin subunit